MSLEELKEYYANLLIIQYQLPNAREEIESYVDVILPFNELTGNLLLNDIANAFDLETAVGVQLDILGKYIGVERPVIDIEIPSQGLFFGFTFYSDNGAADIPANITGFSTYDNFDVFPGNFPNYEIIGGAGRADDETYRTLLKFKILINNSNGSRNDIASSLFAAFGTDILVTSGTNIMELIYFVTESAGIAVEVAIENGLLPKPAGVKIANLIETNGAETFKFANYQNYTNTFGQGFKDYSTISTNGNFLNYARLQD